MLFRINGLTQKQPKNKAKLTLKVMGRSRQHPYGHTKQSHLTLEDRLTTSAVPKANPLSACFARQRPLGGRRLVQA